MTPGPIAKGGFRVRERRLQGNTDALLATCLVATRGGPQERLREGGSCYL